MKTNLKIKCSLLVLFSSAALISVLACDLRPEAVVGKKPDSTNYNSDVGTTEPGNCTQTRMSNTLIDNASLVHDSNSKCTSPVGAITMVTIDDKGGIKFRFKKLIDGNFPKVTSVTLSPYAIFGLSDIILNTQCAAPVLSADASFQEVTCAPVTTFRTGPTEISVHDIAVYPRQVVLVHPTCGEAVTYQRYMVAMNDCQAPSDPHAPVNTGIDSAIVPPLWVETADTTSAN